jgi:hypothetical protein
MSERPTDPRVDDELREVLRSRDPGPAPFELRQRLLDIPERVAGSQPSRPRRPLAAVVGIAAVILLAVIGFTTIRNMGHGLGPGASASGAATSSPSAVESPAGRFDPTLEGPGISATDDLSPAIIVLPACAVLGLLAMTMRGRRRVAAAVAAMLLAGWAGVGILAPVTVHQSGYGLGLNTVWAPKVPGSEEELLYELAPANGRFSVGLFFLPEGPLPIRIEGIVSPFFGRDPRSFSRSIPMLTAVWIDGEPNGGITGPIRPLTPFDVPRNGQAIWLVGHAGGCALGSAFDPSNPGTEIGFQVIDSLDLRVSVLGWPRTVHLALPFRLVEPEPPSCPELTPEASGSPST